jgi:hypothetical protein
VLSQVLPAKASAAVFCPDTQGASRGLAIATETCEMLFLAKGGEEGSRQGAIRQLAGTVGSRAAQVPSIHRIAFWLSFFTLVTNFVSQIYKVAVPGLATSLQQEVVDTGDVKKSTPAVSTLPVSKPVRTSSAVCLRILASLSGSYVLLLMFRDGSGITSTSAQRTSLPSAFSVVRQNIFYTAFHTLNTFSDAPVSSAQLVSSATSALPRQQ